MKIEEYETLIAYIKEHYPSLVDKFHIWHDFEEGKENPELWGLYWGEDWNDDVIYSIDVRLVHSWQENLQLKETKILFTDLQKRPESYIEKLEGIARSIRDCDDGGDIKYIMRDAEEVLKERYSLKENDDEEEEE